jgi:hypothetical protein
MSPRQINRQGVWVPAIPLGLRLPLARHQCQHPGCGRTFWSRSRYRGHYALVHILELDE